MMRSFSVRNSERSTNGMCACSRRRKGPPGWTTPLSVAPLPGSAPEAVRVRDGLALATAGEDERRRGHCLGVAAVRAPGGRGLALVGLHAGAVRLHLVPPDREHVGDAGLASG